MPSSLPIISSKVRNCTSRRELGVIGHAVHCLRLRVPTLNFQSCQHCWPDLCKGPSNIEDDLQLSSATVPFATAFGVRQRRCCLSLGPRQRTIQKLCNNAKPSIQIWNRCKLRAARSSPFLSVRITRQAIYLRAACCLCTGAIPMCNLRCWW